MVLELVDEIRCRNSNARIFFSALLPRPIDNTDAKPKIVRFNRNLFAAVSKANKKFQKVKSLAVQHRFIQNSLPMTNLFNSDRLMLNDQGV